MLAKMMENIPTAILNVLFQFVFILSFILWIILEAPLNNNAIPSKDIPIIEVYQWKYH